MVNADAGVDRVHSTPPGGIVGVEHKYITVAC
jgi:hypothetical protein